MNFEGFIDFIKQGLPINATQEEQFKALEALYKEWNTKINVISRKDIDGFYLHHVIHSLCIAAYLQAERPDVMAEFTEGGSTVLDLGTGGGFPGIPLAIMFPKTDFLLCDSIGKKITVASEIAAALGLENVQCVNARAETLGKDFDYVVSRAVTSLDKFYPWVKGRFRKDIFYLKGGDTLPEEIATLCRTCSVNPKSISTWKVRSWIDNEYFDAKFVVDIRK